MFNFHIKKKFLRIIAGITATLVLAVAIFIFVCPMVSMTYHEMTTPTISVSCATHAGHAAFPLGAGSADCLDWHLSIMQQFMNSLFVNLNVFMIALLLALCGYIIVFEILRFTRLQLRSLLARFKHRYFHYFQIRQTFQEKILAWLSYTYHPIPTSSI